MEPAALHAAELVTVWLPVQGFEGAYEVSCTGEVRSDPEWASHAQTMAKAARMKLIPKRGGDRGGTVKLTWPRVREIRRLRAAGKSTRKLAEMFSVKPQTIRRAVAGTSWVDDPGSIPANDATAVPSLETNLS